MNTHGGGTWLLPEEGEVEHLLAELKGVFFDVVALPEYSATVAYADTFDWRLYRQEYLLHNHGSSWTLYHGDTCEVTLQQGGPRLAAPCFAADFPEGRLRDVLAPVLGIRCLLPVATLHLNGRQYRLLNEDEKTVARLVVERQRPEGLQNGYCLARLFAVRGYDQELTHARRILGERAGAQESTPLIGFEQSCRAAGRFPLDYSSKFNVTLLPDSAARLAMTEIYLQLLENIRRNIPGVIADWDSEFLHDFRVAVRRTRSGLSLVKHVLPDAVVVRFKKEFAALGNLTGPTRDLDVYLLCRQDFLNRLPPFLQPGLALFFDQLARRRHGEQKQLARRLRTKKMTALLMDWQRCLERQDRRPAPLADAPIKEVADSIIRRHHKQVVRSGFSLETTSPDTEVHRLRIQCKKLRYAMEFFSSLYPRDEIQTVVQHLKKLQDILGTFNDLSVQQALVRNTLEAIGNGSGGKNGAAMAASLGGLMQSLFQEQQTLRGHFKEAFAQFADEETTLLCHQLFRKQRDSR
jgi:CHAD domain-containing protein